MKKSTKRSLILLGCVLLLAIISSACFFELKEGESIIVQRFGRIEAIYVKEASPQLLAELERDGDPIVVHEGTGLKFKLPFVDNIISYSSLLIDYTTPAHQVITMDKKKIYFDNNAQWRIVNPVRFYKGVRNIDTARDRIDNLLYSRMNVKVGGMQSHVLITSKDVVNEMLANLNVEVSADCAEFGVEVFDIRIKRTDLPEENYQSIYNRMISERTRMAAEYRSLGDEEAIKSRSNTDWEVTKITSEAFKRAEILKGEGDSEAARTFNEAYSKTPEFFEFYNLLDTYRLTIGKGTTLVIPLDSPFAKYLLGATMSLQ